MSAFKTRMVSDALLTTGFFFLTIVGVVLFLFLRWNLCWEPGRIQLVLFGVFNLDSLRSVHRRLLLKVAIGAGVLIFNCC